MTADTRPWIAELIAFLNEPKKEPGPKLVLTPLEQARFDAKVTRAPNGCWLWTGAKNSRGYGCLGLRKVPWLAHRLASTVAHGAIPKGYEVDHTCHNADLTCRGGKDCPHRRCVNPDHLEQVSATVNANRSNAALGDRPHRQIHTGVDLTR